MSKATPALLRQTSVILIDAERLMRKAAHKMATRSEDPIRRSDHLTNAPLQVAEEEIEGAITLTAGQIGVIRETLDAHLKEMRQETPNYNRVSRMIHPVIHPDECDETLEYE